MEHAHQYKQAMSKNEHFGMRNALMSSASGQHTETPKNNEPISTIEAYEQE